MDALLPFPGQSDTPDSPESGITRLGPVAVRYRTAIEGYAHASGIPLIRFGKGDRKIDVIRRFLEAA
jgi:hypothetical protein